MKKGVAVPYIIAIILGIAVIGLIGYWFFVSGGRLGTTATKTKCEEYRLQYCQEWRATGYPTAPGAQPWIWTGPTGSSADPRTTGCPAVGVNEPTKAICEGLA